MEEPVLDLEKEIQLIRELAEKMLASIKQMTKTDEETGKTRATGEAVLSWTHDYPVSIVMAARDILVCLKYVEEIIEGSDGDIVRTFYSLTSKGEKYLAKPKSNNS